MKIAGIDENGRGSIIGPLVITCFIITEKELEKLKELGVKDSKKLDKEKREKLFEILKKFEFYYEFILPNEIDYNLLSKKNSLNELEAIYMAKLINSTDAQKYFIDSPSNPKNFYKKLNKYLKREVEIVLENKLDEKNLVVAAASIIGKVIRDREIEKIKEEIKEEIGSGYPGDKKTLDFIKKAIKEKRDFDFIRKSWITYLEEKKKIKIKKLTDFL
ncbi:MAG: ribonuclease HII [Candidatus Aenigmatarchaeota archaeon]